jgi:hypothetical protein
MDFLDFYLLTESLADYLPEFFEFVKKQPDDACVHFTNWFRVGYNRKPPHQDPIGVYCFPKKYVLMPEFKNNSHFFSMTNAYILKPKGGRVLNLSTVSLPEVQRISQTMQLPVNPVEKPDHKSLGLRNITSKPGHSLWDAMEKSLLNMGLERGTKNYQWNKWFKMAGIDTLVDDGDSIIHSNEPYQVVFMTPGTFQEITKFQHSASNIYRKVAIRIMQSVGAKLLDNGKFDLRYRGNNTYKDERTIYIHGNFNGIPISLYGVYYQHEDLRHSLRMSVNFSSGRSEESIYNKHKVEVEFDPSKPNIEEQVDKIVKELRETISKPGFFREDKTVTSKSIMTHAMSILKISGKLSSDPQRPEEFELTKRIRELGGTLNIRSYYSASKYTGNKYLLLMSFKFNENEFRTIPALHSGQDIEVEEKEAEAHPEAAARKMIKDTINYWDESQKKIYPIDKEDWSSAETGKRWAVVVEYFKKLIE